MSFEVILPFLRPIQHLILDDDISEIMVNGTGRVFVERRGQIEAHDGIALSQSSLEVAIKNIARKLGDDVSDENPILDSRLPDGSRVAAVLPPCSVGGITLTIRKFNNRRWTLDELVRIGCMPPAVLDSLTTAMRAHKNILISGGTGTGKTTMLNALTSLIPDSERLVVIEDTSEIQINAPNLVRFEARRKQGDIPEVTIRHLLRATLRHRPDRIILGEIRGGEAFDLLQALNTGHSGSLSTIHANSAVQALSRFSNCVLQSGVELPYAAVQSTIASALHFLLHITRKNGQRCVAEFVEVSGYSLAKDEYKVITHYRREFPADQDGPASPTDPDLIAVAAATNGAAGPSGSSLEKVYVPK